MQQAGGATSEHHSHCPAHPPNRFHLQLLSEVHAARLNRSATHARQAPWWMGWQGNTIQLPPASAATLSKQMLHSCRLPHASSPSRAGRTAGKAGSFGRRLSAGSVQGCPNLGAACCLHHDNSRCPPPVQGAGCEYRDAVLLPST